MESAVGNPLRNTACILYDTITASIYSSKAAFHLVDAGMPLLPAYVKCNVKQRQLHLSIKACTYVWFGVFHTYPYRSYGIYVRVLCGIVEANAHWLSPFILFSTLGAREPSDQVHVAKECKRVPGGTVACCDSRGIFLLTSAYCNKCILPIASSVVGKAASAPSIYRYVSCWKWSPVFVDSTCCLRTNLAFGRNSFFPSFLNTGQISTMCSRKWVPAL